MTITYYPFYYDYNSSHWPVHVYFRLLCRSGRLIIFFKLPHQSLPITMNCVRCFHHLRRGLSLNMLNTAMPTCVSVPIKSKFKQNNSELLPGIELHNHRLQRHFTHLGPVTKHIRLLNHSVLVSSPKDYRQLTISAKHLVDSSPEKVQPYMRLMRLDRPIGELDSL